jgi:hypothetical protein
MIEGIIMAIKLEEGSTLTLSQALNDGRDSSGNKLNWSRAGLTYTATSDLNDSSGRSETFTFDTPEPTVVIRRTVTTAAAAAAHPLQQQKVQVQVPQPQTQNKRQARK